MIGLPRTATHGHEFLNKKLIRGDRLEMYDHGRLPMITDAYGRLRALGADSQCGAFAPSACDRVKPYPNVTGP